MYYCMFLCVCFKCLDLVCSSKLNDFFFLILNFLHCCIVRRSIFDRFRRTDAKDYEDKMRSMLLYTKSHY